MNAPHVRSTGTRWPLRRRVIYAAIGLAVALPTGLALLLWLSPSGSGEVRPSPDGRFEAYAFNMSRGTLSGRRERYVEIRVTEVATGREAWRVVHRHPPEAAVPDYARRGMRFIVWAEDSSAVTVPVAGDQTMAFAVP